MKNGAMRRLPWRLNKQESENYEYAASDTLPRHWYGLSFLRRQDREGGSLSGRGRCEGFDRDADHDVAPC
ncbi:protein of unknown function [Candidatus Filomicrobium marinum]|uniref:Uncharacterized protein n=1 Tax=Candidatus Filomicrobium marinum TaxID=1608628 RepID=A0A0D6JIM5_9HYPH|nr:protein of unknown function [Candidatus Filomicrobium marinum]CPR21854.1 protein of unknown function [Candidatus Filomicrobium marinum]